VGSIVVNTDTAVALEVNLNFASAVIKLQFMTAITDLFRTTGRQIETDFYRALGSRMNAGLEQAPRADSALLGLLREVAQAEWFPVAG
jgi:hypothetical protein